MKVLHLTPFYRPEIGGIAEHVYNLHNFLQKEGVDSAVLHVVENAEGNSMERVSDSEYRLHLAGSLDDHRKILRKGEIRAYIKEHISGVNILHIHTFNRLEFVGWRWINWIWTAHLSDLPRIAKSRHPKDLMLRLLYRAVYRDAKRIIAVSRHQIPFIRKITGRSDIHVIPNGIDLSRFRGDTEPLLQKRGRKIILCPSAWRRIKGIDILIDAMKHMKRHYPDIFERSTLVLIESRHEPEYHRMLMRELEDLEDHVVLLKPVDRDLMPSLYASADIVVIPSRYESFGISILEAMAMGKPVIASRTGGIPDIIEDGKSGLLFQTEDHESLARMIAHLLDNSEELKRIGSSARRRAEDFSWNRIAREVIKLYEQSL